MQLMKLSENDFSCLLFSVSQVKYLESESVWNRLQKEFLRRLDHKVDPKKAIKSLVSFTLSDYNNESSFWAKTIPVVIKKV